MKRRGEVRTKHTKRPRFEVLWRAQKRSAASTGAMIRKATLAVLSRHSVRSALIEITGISDRRMARLNEERLGHHGATDVLTFELGNGDFEVEGEVVISLDTARREARRRGHSASAEAALYAVHGVLHLLGYDDLRPKEAARMHRIEDEVLASVGAGPVYSRGIEARRP